MQTKYYLTFEQVGIIRRIPLKEQDPDIQGILDAFIQAFRITNELDDDDTVNTVDLINASFQYRCFLQTRSYPGSKAIQKEETFLSELTNQSKGSQSNCLFLYVEPQLY